MKYKNIFDTVKANIIKARKAKGYSQTDLAGKMSTSQRLIAYYETKTKTISLDKLVEFAEALNVSLGTLLDEKPVNNVPVDIDLKLLKKVKQIDELPRRAKESLMHTINTTLEMNKMKKKS